MQSCCNKPGAGAAKMQSKSDCVVSVASIHGRRGTLASPATLASPSSNAAKPAAASSAIGLLNSIERSLLARGIRLTRQRLAVVKVIEEVPQCRNVGVILRRAKKFNAAIHRGTVYRTLALLERHGMLARETGCVGTCPYAGECAQVQMNCLQCGKKIEFASGLFGDVARCVEKDCRFRVASAVLNISGYCQDCRV